MQLYSDGASNVLKKLRKFLPIFQGIKDEKIIKIQNIMEGLDGKRASLMDLKIGKSTVTVKCQKLNKQKSRLEKDLATISH